MYTIDILTLFPGAVDAMMGESILGRAQKKGLIAIQCHQIRDYTTNKQNQVDDYPYGGGRGCVMQAQPLHSCWEHVRALRGGGVRTVFLSPCGKPFTQRDARRLRDDYTGLILVCGHYEGVDERFIEECVDEELSLGDFVLTGGEIPAMAVADAVCRLVPGVLSDEVCFTDESHWSGLLEYPQYSRPEVWRGRQVPAVLLSGNHAEIQKWRWKQSVCRTRLRRPDMYEKLTFETKQEKKLLDELRREWEEARMENLLNKYADLVVRKGVNVQPGQTLVIACSVDAADFGRRCVKAAYAAGAREVIVRWGDDIVTRERYLHGADEIFDVVRPWVAEQYNTLSEEGAAFLSISSSDPEAMAGVDPSRMRRSAIASGKVMAPYRNRTMSNQVQWCVVAVPHPAWAKKMFPDMSPEKAMKHQWEAILSTVRVSEDNDPVADWEVHNTATRQRVQRLNEYRFRSLHYKNSLGTDLTVELPQGHFWAGGSEDTPKGVTFIANMPTEEVFTAPKRDGVNGVVYASKPLVINGNIVEGFHFVFKDGRIVEYHAKRGEELLKNSLATDEGALYLGEVALVPYDSPISRSGLLFYDTLFDENASCHFAYGAAYPCVEGAAEKSPAERLAMGLNDSITHKDFMVGTKDLSITGVTADGQEIPVFVDGNFAF